MGNSDDLPRYRDRKMLLLSTGRVDDAFILTNNDEKPYRACGVNDTDRCAETRQEVVHRAHTQSVREKTNFSLNLRGDTPGTDRIANALHACSIPVGIEPDDDAPNAYFWLPYQDIVPWKDIIVTLPRKSYDQDPAKTVNSLRDLNDTDIQNRLHLIDCYRPDLLWTIRNSRKAENLIRQAYDVPCDHYSPPKTSTEDKETKLLTGGDSSSK